jgi:hypothetical protein
MNEKKVELIRFIGPNRADAISAVEIPFPDTIERRQVGSDTLEQYRLVRTLNGSKVYMLVNVKK